MQFSQHQPARRLRTVVKAIWRARGTRAEFSAPEPIVPDGCVEIVFNLADRFIHPDTGALQPRALLAGQMTRPVVALPTGDVDLLGIRFATGRGGRALRTPMWQLQDALVDASAIIPGIDRLADDLGNVREERRLAYLAGQLSRYLAIDDATPINAVDHALAMIEGHHGILAIDAIARQVGITRRHLERRFRDEVGLGAKSIARIRRVHAALAMMRARPMLSGAEIAVDCGYSDQAHLIHECKTLTGRTPARLMTSERSLAALMREAGEARSV